jgi:hypothetical protein
VPPPTPAPRRPSWRRPAVLLALAFAAILGMAPWAAIIDDAERPRRR